MAPVFGLVLFGWVAVRTGAFDDAATRGLSVFVFNFAIPVMLVRTLGSVALPAQPDWGLLVTYFGSALAVFGLGALIARRGFGQGGAAPAIFGITASFSNLVVLGIPLVLEAFGEAAAVPLFLLVACHSPLLMTVTTLAAEAGAGGGLPWLQVARNVVWSLFTNPIILGLAAGLLLNLAGLGLPPVLDRIALYLSDAALPCALFALGANLARFKLAAAIPAALALTLLKNLVHPLLVLAIGTLVVPLSPLALQVALVVAAAPVGVNPYLFASRYGTATAEATSTILVSTALSVVTLSLILSFSR